MTDEMAEVRKYFAEADALAAKSDAERLREALFIAGPQWGDRSPEDILAAIDAAGFAIVRKPTPAPPSSAEAARSLGAKAPPPAP